MVIITATRPSSEITVRVPTAVFRDRQAACVRLVPIFHTANSARGTFLHTASMLAVSHLSGMRTPSSSIGACR